MPRPSRSTVAPAVVAVAIVWGWAAVVIPTGRVPAGDGPHMLGACIRLSQLFWSGAWGELAYSLPLLLAPHPPGAYLPGMLTYAVFWDVRTAHIWCMAGVLLVAWDGMSRLVGSRWAGVGGLLWLLSSPLVWQQAEGYGVDLLAAVAVVQAVAHLSESRGLRRSRSAVVWGAWMGIAFLTKYTAPMFLWGPCVVAGAVVLWRGRWGTLAKAFGAWCVVALPWYIERGADVLAYVGASNQPTAELSQNTLLMKGHWTEAHNLVWYPAALVEVLGWPAVAAAGVALFWPRRTKSPAATLPLVVAAVIGGWLLLAPQLQRQLRYLLPALPFVAVVLTRVRGWPLLLPIALVGVTQNARVYGDPNENQPIRALAFDPTTTGAAWPDLPEALRPLTSETQVWNLVGAVAALLTATPEDATTVGLLNPSEAGPDTGLVLYRLAEAGSHHHLSSVSFQGWRPGQTDLGPELPTWNGAQLFVAPFATDTWPPRRFETVLVVADPTEPRIEHWLRAGGFEHRVSIPTPNKKPMHVYAIP